MAFEFASPFRLCHCGHSMLLHDVYDADGTDPLCCVQGCDQRGCAAMTAADVRGCASADGAAPPGVQRLSEAAPAPSPVSAGEGVTSDLLTTGEVTA